MAITRTENFGFTIQQSGAAASDKFSMAALNENAQIADEELKKLEDSLNQQTVGLGVTIGEGEDLNNYTTPGTYCSPTAARSKTLINSPTSAYGFRFEVRTIVGGRYVQFVYPNVGGIFYMRNLLSAGWSNWFKFSGEEIVPAETASVEEDV